MSNGVKVGTIIMAHLIEIWYSKSKLEAMLAASNDKGLSTTVSVNDEPNEWGQNVKQYKAQTKEEQLDKAQKTYFGNGRVFWSDGQPPYKPAKVERKQATSATASPTYDPLPFD